MLSNTFHWITSLQLADPSLQSSTATVVENLVGKLRELPKIRASIDISQFRDAAIARKCPIHVLQTYIDGETPVLLKLAAPV